MIQAASSEKARSGRRHISFPGLLPETRGVWRTNYLGYDRWTSSEAAPAMGSVQPIAYLVEQDPDTVIRAHYHRVNQFQVVVGGSGKLGGHELPGGFALHFAGPYSPYGPIDAGHDGIQYLTLRKNYDPGAQYIPEMIGALREERKGKPRQEMAGPLPYETPGQLAARKAAATSILIDPAPDGLGTWRHRIPAGGSAGGADPAGGGGQFWLVLSGGLDHGGDILPPLSCLFVPSAEPAFVAKAGPHGLDILAMQFPKD